MSSVYVEKLDVYMLQQCFTYSQVCVCVCSDKNKTDTHFCLYIIIWQLYFSGDNRYQIHTLFPHTLLTTWIWLDRSLWSGRRLLYERPSPLLCFLMGNWVFLRFRKEIRYLFSCPITDWVALEDSVASYLPDPPGDPGVGAVVSMMTAVCVRWWAERRRWSWLCLCLSNSVCAFSSGSPQDDWTKERQQQQQQKKARNLSSQSLSSRGHECEVFEAVFFFFLFFFPFSLIASNMPSTTPVLSVSQRRYGMWLSHFSFLTVNPLHLRGSATLLVVCVQVSQAAILAYHPCLCNYRSV